MTYVIHPELGQPGNMKATVSAGRDRQTSYAPQPDEHTWELEWPLSLAVFQEMRRSDGQVASLLKAIGLPIQSAQWSLEGADVRPEVMDLVKDDLGMSDTGDGRRRSRHGVVWADHLREVLLMLPFGHVFFEQVYQFRPSDPQHIHLRKLALRLPTTISQIAIARDGGLQGIWQQPLAATQTDPVFIPVDRLVAYVNDREGGDWTGQSVLRTAYKHWLIKDHIMRIDAQAVERNGMGLPVLEYDPANPSARAEAERIVQEVRAGESAGIALPYGEGIGNFQLVGVSGSTVDAVPRMQYHDQQVSRSALAMFLDLGHDAGARSLGESQTDFFLASLQALADTIASIVTEHVIRDLVEVNWGPDEPYPIMSPGNLKDNGDVALDTLGSLASNGLITPDAKLEEHLRKRAGLPERATATAQAPTTSPAQIDAVVDAARDAAVDAPTVTAATPSTVERVQDILARVTALSSHEGTAWE